MGGILNGDGMMLFMDFDGDSQAVAGFHGDFMGFLWCFSGDFNDFGGAQQSYDCS